MKPVKTNLLWLIIPALIVISLPIILNIGLISSFISWYLESLGNADYKVAYVGFIGAILGTYLAIMGAVWVQKREKRMQEKNEIMKTATIIYYDIKLGCLELIDIIKSIFDKSSLSGDIYLAPDWIERVANLPTGEIDIQKIYSIYGLFSNAKLRLNQLRGEDFVRNLNHNDFQNILTREFVLDITTASYSTSPLSESNPDKNIIIERYVKSDIREMLIKLEKIAGINSTQTEEKLQEYSKDEMPELSIELERKLINLKESFKPYVYAKSQHLKMETEDNKSAMLINFKPVLESYKQLLTCLWQNTSTKEERDAILEWLSKYTNNSKN